MFGLTLALVLAPVMLAIGLAILLVDGGPVFYVSDRARTPDETFRLVKFRTMRPDPGDRGASGGHKEHRVTRTGRFLRRSRIDELPQLWNILRGDMSFVGPRPPLMLYVRRFPEIYREVLSCRPGVTGLASVFYHEHEERLLRTTTGDQDNETIYERRCIPRKARLDMIYAENRSLRLDIWLILATLSRRFR
ncbi:lipopolysaccharide/colanic/teichoic acid biosynthesis glycosyltransferase [Erythrobacter lutimaris]|nr:lipopolysaccharide/colanic/teichoic acid biosynthesis glycosyltransferase [Alteriqipengyuania lutimaris]